MKEKPGAFDNARRKATELLNDREKVFHLLDRAIGQISSASNSAKLQEISMKLQALIRMIRAYFRKEYTDIPWQTLLLALTAVIYFLNPFDAIPDIIPLFGFTDDIAIITAIFASVSYDIERFLTWESGKGDDEPQGDIIDADIEES